MNNASKTLEFELYERYNTCPEKLSENQKIILLNLREELRDFLDDSEKISSWKEL